MKLAAILLLIHDDAIFRPSWKSEQKRYEILIFSTGWLNHLAIFFTLITLGLEQPQQRFRCFPDPRDPWNLHHRVCRLSIDLLQAECLFVRKKRTYGLMFDTYSIYTCVLMMLLWCSICTIFINIWWYVSIYIYMYITWYINNIYIYVCIYISWFICLWFLFYVHATKR